MNILTLPNPILRTKANEAQISDALKILAKEMLAEIKGKGVGLAAPQIGKSIRMFVMDVEKKQYALLNPQVLSIGGSMVEFEEGCLSYPGFVGPVVRPDKISIEAIDIETGKKTKIKASGLLARVIQHEIDHLDGILFIDRVSNPKLLKRSDSKSGI